MQVQQKDLSDEAIARAVCVKVGDSPGVSYSDIAATAYECGRTELAIKVSQCERYKDRKGKMAQTGLNMVLNVALLHCCRFKNLYSC